MLDPALVTNSFYVTYAFLITTGTITFIEAIRTTNPTIRHIMNLETVISIIAAYFYSLFVARTKDLAPGAPLPYADINRLRYTDWMISTPFMLLSLCIVLGYENRVPLTLPVISAVVALDYAMLYLGYAGEGPRPTMNKKAAWVASFACFAALYALIAVVFLRVARPTVASLASFAVFVVLWSIYGLVYFAREDVKILTYNVLDLCAKCLTGIFFWLYFTKVIVVA